MTEGVEVKVCVCVLRINAAKCGRKREGVEWETDELGRTGGEVKKA